MKTPPQTTSRTARWRAELRSVAGMLLLVLGIHSLLAKPFYIPSESMVPNLLVGDRLVVSKYPYGWSYASASFHLLPFMHGRLFGRLPARGDIVTLTPPGGRHEDLIKRVIGLPGDRIAMANGRLWLNGRPVPTRDLGREVLPTDANFRCDPQDSEPERAFPGFAGASMRGPDGRIGCRVHVLQETLPDGVTYQILDFGPTSLDDFPTYIVPAGHVFVLGDNRDNSADSRVPVALGGLGGAIPIEAIGGRAEFTTFSLTGEASWNPLTWQRAFRSGRNFVPLRPHKN